MPLVDIITPTYRRSALLPEYFAMLRAQSLRDFRVLLVNDDPSESLAEVVTTHAADLNVLLLEPGINQRVAAARNLGLAHASAPYVALCDDDDVWLSQHLQQTVAALVSSGADLVYGGVELVASRRGAGGRQAEARRRFAFLPDHDFLRQWNSMPPSSLVYRRALHEELGPFDTDIPHYADWDWVLRVSSAGKHMRLSLPVSVEIMFDLGGDNQSANPVGLNRSPELQRLINKHALGELPSSNFWLMLEVPEVAARVVGE